MLCQTVTSTVLHPVLLEDNHMFPTCMLLSWYRLTVMALLSPIHCNWTGKQRCSSSQLAQLHCVASKRLHAPGGSLRGGSTLHMLAPRAAQEPLLLAPHSGQCALHVRAGLLTEGCEDVCARHDADQLC